MLFLLVVFSFKTVLSSTIFIDLITRGQIMADNFDSNVARRKPTVAENIRPAHPWDVPAHLPEEDPEIVIDPSVPDAPASLVNIDSASAVSAVMENRAPEHDHANHEPLNTRKNDLSDTISIHSNFCKLDNDVSDFLFQGFLPLLSQYTFVCTVNLSAGTATGQPKVFQNLPGPATSLSRL